MHFVYPHKTTKAKVRSAIDDEIEKALTTYAIRIDDLDRRWDDDTLVFAIRAYGQSASGTAEVTDTDVIVDVRLPLMLKPFEGKAQSRIISTMDEMLA